MLTRREALFGTAAGAATAAILTAMPAAQAAAQAQPDVSSLPRQRVELVAPPFVHAHDQVARGGPKIVEFRLTVKEQPMVIDDEGTVMQAMTFNGSIPAPMMVVHEGDYVELTLVNPETNGMPHNVDFHAATGGLGGAQMLEVMPGEQATMRFKATRAGAFVYHCAPAGMIPWHVTSGMNGAILVLPRDGLKDGAGKRLKYDRIYYVGESDFYIPRDKDGKYKQYESDPDPRRLQRQGRRADGRQRPQGQGRGDDPHHPLAGQSRYAPAHHRRPWRSCLGDRQVRQPAGEGSRDLVRARWIGLRGALHVPTARHLCLCEPQPDRGC
jgi:FtsP/CotA-like multicopper oxidase with cupredoxin domain